MSKHIHRPQQGFTYLNLIVLLTIIGMSTTYSVRLGKLYQRSWAEQELLLIGTSFSLALESYAAATPPGYSTLPATLEDLLRDPRFSIPKRHLRKIFTDPITGRAEWGIVYLGEEKGVLAVYSLSDDRPMKIGNFPNRFQSFSDKLRISDWKFTGKQAQPATQL